MYLQLDAGGILYASDDASSECLAALFLFGSRVLFYLDYKCLPSITTDTGPCDYPLVGMVEISNSGIIAGVGGGGAINGGANDPPGHMVSSYDSMTNFLIPTGMPRLYSFSSSLSPPPASPRVFLGNL